MLSVIGDRAHGEKSINGVRADERGPATKSQLNNIVDTACQKGRCYNLQGDEVSIDILRPQDVQEAQHRN